MIKNKHHSSGSVILKEIKQSIKQGSSEEKGEARTILPGSRQKTSSQMLSWNRDTFQNWRSDLAKGCSLSQIPLRTVQKISFDKDLNPWKNVSSWNYKDG